MEKLPLDWNQVSLTFFKVFDKNTSKIETTEEHLHCWPCRLSWKKSTVQNLFNRLPSLHHSASYLAVWWWKMGQKTDNQKAVEMSKYKKTWYLCTNERFLYIWQQNENQINPKMRTKRRGKSFLHQQHLILGTEGKANSKWEVVTAWWKRSLSDFLHHLQLVTAWGCWLPSLRAHCREHECGFDLYTNPSFWKTREKQEVLLFPLFLISLNTNMPSATCCIWVPSCARYFLLSCNSLVSKRSPPSHPSCHSKMLISWCNFQAAPLVESFKPQVFKVVSVLLNSKRFNQQ